MSGRDNVFARWSRRKLATRSEETHQAAEAEQGPGTTAPALDADGADATGPQAMGDAADPAEPLPRVEDLNAESDLAAFLKKGVPVALKAAALRKMWSLDPGIRDFVGPSEYAWDFNKPGAMAGFGPLETKQTVVGFLSKTARALEDDPPAAPAAPTDAVDQAMNAPPAAAPETGTLAPAPAAEPLAAAPPVGAAGDAEDQSHAAASRPQPPDPVTSSQTPETLPRPRHGGALPR